MAQTKDLVINNFQTGIGESHYTGFGRMQNLEIFQVPGSFKMKYRSVLSFTPVGLPMAIVKDIYGNVYVGTDQGYLYKNGTILGTPKSVIWDLKVWNNYLFITYATTMDVYGPLDSGGATTFPNWLGLSLVSSYGHGMLPLQGNTMYICNGGNVATITSFAAGAVGVAPTATYNSTAIPLPSGDYARCLAELGRTILIGCQSGASFYDLYTVSQSNIYPYDLGTLTLGYAIAFEENGINQMFTQGNIAYVNAGIYGNIYRTNGSSVDFYKTVLFGRSFGETITPYPNAINYVNNELLVGTAYAGSSATSLQGVYSIRPGGKLNFRTISTTNTGSTQPLKIGAIYPTGQDTMLIGWQDGTTYGVDTIDFNTFVNSAYFESQVYKVGTYTDNVTYEHLDIQLTRPLITGQQIKVYWRDGINSSWILMATFTSASVQSGSTALYSKAIITDANTLQIRCELSQPTSTVFPNNIEVTEVRIRL